MKHFFFALLALICIFMLGGCSDTQEFSSQSSEIENTDTNTNDEPLSVLLGVPETVEGDFVSESGISRVTVDADVIFPDVYQVNLYVAIPRVYTEDEIHTLIERHEDEIGWYYVNSDIPYKNELPAISDISGSVDMYQLWIDNNPIGMQYSEKNNLLDQIRESLPEKQAENYQYAYLYINYGLMQNTGDIGFPPGMIYKRSNYALNSDQLLPLVNGKAEDCTITLEEAIAMADKEVQTILPDYRVSAYGQLPLQELGNQSQYYIFRYTRHLDAIPVNDSYAGESVASDYGYVSGLGVVTVIVNDQGVCLFEYHNPYNIGKMVETNVELLPFSSIWDIFSNLSLLSIQHLEVYENLQKNEMEVYEIRFGYMSILQADGSYLYTPVWDFYATRSLGGTGEYAHADEQEPIYGRSLLTINAINGTIIDRNLGY